MEEEKRIPAYVVSNFKHFTRKIYGLAGLNLGRSIYLKSFLYALGTVFLMIVLRHIPVINFLFTWIPFIIAYLLIPVGVAYLLTDIPTEERKPHQFFVSFLQYQYRRAKKIAYFGGRAVRRRDQYKIGGSQFSYRVKSPEIEKKEKVKRYKLKGVFYSKSS